RAVLVEDPAGRAGEAGRRRSGNAGGGKRADGGQVRRLRVTRTSPSTLVMISSVGLPSVQTVVRARPARPGRGTASGPFACVARVADATKAMSASRVARVRLGEPAVKDCPN